MSRRLGLLLAVGGAVIVMVGLLFVVVILRQATAPIAQPTAVPPVTVPVVVSARTIPVRSLVRAADVNVIQMPAEFVPLDAASSVEDVVGKITMIPFATGELVMRHHLAEPTNISENLAFIVGDDQVVMAFPATDLMSQVDVLQPGDLVDILISIEVPVLPNQLGGVAGGEPANGGEPDKELFTFNALQKVTIQAIVVEIQANPRTASTTTTTRSSLSTPEPTPTLGPEEINAQAILVALAPQDALVLKHLKDAGGIADIVLRAPTSSQVLDLDPVSPEYLKDRYGLVVEQPAILASPTPAP
jgi:pilus assembly protein CpaB